MQCCAVKHECCECREDTLRFTAVRSVEDTVPKLSELDSISKGPSNCQSSTKREFDMYLCMPRHCWLAELLCVRHKAVLQASNAEACTNTCRTLSLLMLVSRCDVGVKLVPNVACLTSCSELCTPVNMGSARAGVHHDTGFKDAACDGCDGYECAYPKVV